MLQGLIPWSATNMNSFQLAIYLTSIGISQGRRYSYMGVEVFNINDSGRREYIVRHGQQDHKFKSAGDAGVFFTNYVTKLRRG